MTAWLMESEAAEYLRYNPDHFRHLRYAGRGPRFHRNPAGGIRYRLVDLDAWAGSEPAPDDEVDVEAVEAEG